MKTLKEQCQEMPIPTQEEIATLLDLGVCQTLRYVMLRVSNQWYALHRFYVGVPVPPMLEMTAKTLIACGTLDYVSESLPDHGHCELRGEQVRMRIEDARYELVDDYGDEVILKKYEIIQLWQLDDAHPGFTLEINGRGYKFVKQLKDGKR